MPWDASNTGGSSNPPASRPAPDGARGDVVRPESGRSAFTGSSISIDRRLMHIRRRLMAEAMLATSMLEKSVDAFVRLDVESAQEVRRRDDRVDREEVAIEQECHELLTLYHPFAKDFRVLAFVLKVNADVERVADHACSIAKAVIKVRESLPPGASPPRWPTALIELGQRVPLVCHQLLRAVIDEDAEMARRLVASDKTIDAMDRRLFDETRELMRLEPGNPTLGLMIYRVGRELERVGDLMANVAEDVVYLVTGTIIRHASKNPANPVAPSTEAKSATTPTDDQPSGGAASPSA
ncbi:MAG: phosphate signaling complex protein PhoU [Planctomycetota bacterium]|nr:phosphate signaling complex protein PhoU [Planctomycetota bacterium]